MKHEALQRATAHRHDAHRRIAVEETLADETPVAFFYNGHSHAVMMATPADLEDFAYGFTLAEGIVERLDEIELIDCFRGPAGISLQLLIPRARFLALDQQQRSLVGRTGCGLCGATTLEAAIRPVRVVLPSIGLALGEVMAGFESLTHAQPLNALCGALHAAALLTTDGMLVREEVGRHNAVDKVIGAAARRGVAPRGLLVTSRASYEVVHKAAQANCPLVAAISAPTARAVRIARDAGITLIGFARGHRLTVYAGRPEAHW